MPEAGYLQHLGIYGYRKRFLLDFAASAPSHLEGVEALEQLRATILDAAPGAEERRQLFQIMRGQPVDPEPVVTRTRSRQASRSVPARRSVGGPPSLITTMTVGWI